MRQLLLLTTTAATATAATALATLIAAAGRPLGLLRLSGLRGTSRLHRLRLDRINPRPSTVIGVTSY
jgi:LAS superfamily LD-carboxypeptidase LdcB